MSGNSIFRFWRSSVWISVGLHLLTFQPTVKKAPFSPESRQHCLFGFLMAPTLSRVRGFLGAVCICISVMARHAAQNIIFDPLIFFCPGIYFMNKCVSCTCHTITFCLSFTLYSLSLGELRPFTLRVVTEMYWLDPVIVVLLCCGFLHYPLWLNRSSL